MKKEVEYRFTDSHQFNVGIAQKYGVETAIILQHLHYWIDRNEANGINLHDGKYWTFNSAKAFMNIFPYWSAKSISRRLADMETKGLIISGNYNEDARDRTKWYTLSKSAQSIFHFCTSQLSKVSKTNPKSVPPLPDNKPNINTDNNIPSISPKGDVEGQESTLMERFEVFYKAYPKHKSRGDAEKAWKALKPTDELLQIMLKAIREQIKSSQWRDIQYVPYPATWLRAKGWEDEQQGSNTSASESNTRDNGKGGDYLC